MAELLGTAVLISAGISIVLLAVAMLRLELVGVHRPPAARVAHFHYDE